MATSFHVCVVVNVKLLGLTRYAASRVSIPVIGWCADLTSGEGEGNERSEQWSGNLTN